MAIVLDPLPTDDDLLVRLRDGDDFAFGALVDRHRAWLVRLCTRLLGHDAHAAEDVAQDCLLKLHSAARDGRPLRIRPWLTVVARNRCVDEQRRRRPDLPGDLPERAAPGDELAVDAALTDAWSRLSGRHREVLYLREVLGFSYKEIGNVMGLTMAATETLVFRARGALRREYERSGGSSFGCVLLGVHLARLGVDNKNPGIGPHGVTSRLTQLLTSLPGCGEQAMAKFFTVAAGVVAAAASVTAGLGPFAGSPPAAASAAPPGVATAVTAAAASPAEPATGTLPAPGATPVVPLKTLLGNAVPSDWTPKPAATAAPSTTRPAAQPEPVASAETPRRATPLRDALIDAERPRLRRPDRETTPGPIRDLLEQRPDHPGWEERPRPLRALLTEPIPFLLESFPADLPPLDEAPAEPLPERDPESPGPIRENVEPIIATFSGDDGTPLRLRDR